MKILSLELILLLSSCTENLTSRGEKQLATSESLTEQVVGWEERSWGMEKTGTKCLSGTDSWYFEEL